MTLTVSILVPLLLIGLCASPAVRSAWARLAPAVLSFAAFLVLWLAGHDAPGAPGLMQVVTMGVATGIVFMLCRMLPETVMQSRNGVGYMLAGTVIGALLGWMLPAQQLVLGSVLGGALGALAFGMTPQGRAMEFPGKRFFNYALARLCPIVVSVINIGMIVRLA